MNQRLILWLVGCAGALLLLMLRGPEGIEHPGVALIDMRMHTASAQLATASVIRADFDDSKWPQLSQRELGHLDGPYWLRIRFRFEPGLPPPEALMVGLRAASESWWDGRWLGRNGQPGKDAATEQPGQLDWYSALDRDMVQPGTHVLVIHASSFHRGFNPYSGSFIVRLGCLQALLSTPLKVWLVVAIASGGMLAVLAFFALTARSARQAGTPASDQGEVLLLALGAVSLLLLLTEAWRPVFGYAYSLHRVRMWLVLFLSAGASVLLPAYLARRYGLTVGRGAQLLAGVLVLTAILLPSFDLAGACLHLFAMLGALLVLWRTRSTAPASSTLQRAAERRGVTLLLGFGLAVMLLAPMRFADGPYFVFIGALLVLLLLQHASQLNSARRALQELETQRARLQAELLRVNIQPHWLMNTLTALQELIEQQPAKASQMVEALAREFELLRRVSTRARISLEEELELCRVHLEIMAMARLQPFQLELEGAPRGIEVPPGILHTLVENGLTHAGLASDGQFKLAVARESGVLRLRLRAPLGSRTQAAGSGTGTRFIEARLQTEYPGRWTFRQQPLDGSWESCIEIGTAHAPADH